MGVVEKGAWRLTKKTSRPTRGLEGVCYPTTSPGSVVVIRTRITTTPEASINGIGY